MVDQNQTLMPDLSIDGINNGDTVIITGTFKSDSYGESRNDLRAIPIERINP
ncbi:hypothetical protein Metfor_1199 [Methanoregula formicica SMSP]|uniref:Uncharacterized protein n=1 Tax=Methanoregula formicica (strain DSM 22288 / NBRC 105244 / SMSP) TaxID=593750 RepID=L0HBY8_METFS|nr:hypothetical protein Metfor_1199 [Methanoregula formicica SMSP]